MKTFSLILFPLLLILLASVLYIYVKQPAFLHSTRLVPTPTTAAVKPHIIFPAKNDTLLKGKIYTLQWTPGSGQTNIFLVNKALETAGVSVSIADRVYHIDDIGMYSYTVPTTIPDGTYKLEIGDLVSDYFTIKTASATTTSCSPQNLQATLSLNPGAGNVYGTFQIKNISHITCSVVGNNFVQAIYNTQTVKNLAIEHEGQPLQEIFSLSPGQSIYSQVHYPNGPQCSSPTQSTSVAFSYAISPTATITFVNDTGNKNQIVQTCQSQTEKTVIQIWNTANKPITP